MAASTPLNPAVLRTRFPGLVAADKEGHILLDNAGGSQALDTVVAAAGDYLLHSNAQLGAAYPTSVRAAQRVKAGLRAGMVLMNASSIAEIVPGPSATQLTENLAHALAPTIKHGDEIVVTDFDHEANIGCWIRIAAMQGAIIRTWKVNPTTLRPDLADLRAVLSPRTRLVAFSQTSNITGTIINVREVSDLVHAIPGAEVLVDGVAFSPHRLIDVKEFDCDYFVFSVYKVYGTHSALLYGRKSSLLRLSSLNHMYVATDAEPHLKMIVGGTNYENTFALTAVLEYLCSLGGLYTLPSLLNDLDTASFARIRAALTVAFDRIAIHEEMISKIVLDGLLALAPLGLRVVGEKTPSKLARVPTFSFTVDGFDAAAIPPLLEPYKVGIRYGRFSSVKMIDILGLAPRNGVVRASMVHYNTLAEAERFVQVLTQCLRNALPKL